MLLAPLKLVGRCTAALCKMLLAPPKLIGRCIWRSKDDTQTAHADSQHCDSKGGNSNELNQHGLQAQQAHGTTGDYMQHQVRKFCQVHALNAMLGRNAIQLGTMLKICEEHAKDDTALGRNLRLGIGWCSRDGNFADMMIDAFLHFHSITKDKAILSGSKHTSGLRCRHVSEGLTSRSECLCAQVALRKHAA